MAGKIFSKQFLQAWTVGLNLVFSIFIGFGIGYWLDGFFNTSPWLTLIFFVLGLIAGFRELFRLAKKQDNGSDKKDL